MLIYSFSSPETSNSTLRNKDLSENRRHIISRPRFNSWAEKICCRRDRLPTLVFLDFPGVSTGKESACNAGDLGLISGLGRFPGEGKGYPL